MAIFVSVLVGSGLAWGQAAVEYGGATAAVGAVGTTAKPMDVLVSPSETPGPGGDYLPLHSGPPPEVVNRQALEKAAGKVAAKLLLRSVPNKARVWIDEKFVGWTPLLLLMPPGSHKVQMRGDREEHNEQQISLLAHETREVELRLLERYPTTLRLTGMK